jgi:crotonobetainyl-CoA:carnitine CoA-transferase CaiB-like acyl-CoA transferase
LPNSIIRISAPPASPSRRPASTAPPPQFKSRRRASASTAVVLAELGFEAAEIERLVAEKTARPAKT